MPAPIKIILDTDIGDDIDDALALGLILASPELELVGVTTVFGNTAARSRQARSILALAGGRHAKVPVAAGCGASLSSRPLHNWTSYLENHLPNQDGSCLPEAQLPKADPRHGVDFLIDTILAGNGDIVPVTIGALTNLAMALVKEPRIVARIPRIVAMAAEFRAGFAEWNIKCDPEAAHLVVASGIPIDFTTWHIGNVASFTDADLARLGGGTSPLVRNLVAAIAEWRKGWGRYPSLFDPLAVATMMRPDLCTWKRGTVAVELQGSATYGFTTFAEDAKNAATPGRHRVAWDVDREAALGFYLDRILGF